MSSYVPRRLHCPLTLALTLALTLLFAGCERGLVPPVEQEGRAALASGQFFNDAEAGLRFVIPSGMAAETEHYPGVTDPGVIRHMVTLTVQQSEHLRIELWHNPGHTPLAAWFDAHLAFMSDGLAQVSWGPVAPGQVRGMHFVWPRSGQSTGQHIVLFALKDKIIRVTCQDGQDPALMAHFRALVSSLSLTERRP